MACCRSAGSHRGQGDRLRRAFICWASPSAISPQNRANSSAWARQGSVHDRIQWFRLPSSSAKCARLSQSSRPSIYEGYRNYSIAVTRRPGQNMEYDNDSSAAELSSVLTGSVTSNIPCHFVNPTQVLSHWTKLQRDTTPDSSIVQGPHVTRQSVRCQDLETPPTVVHFKCRCSQLITRRPPNFSTWPRRHFAPNQCGRCRRVRWLPPRPEQSPLRSRDR